MLLHSLFTLVSSHLALAHFSLEELNSVFYDVKMDVNNPLSFSNLEESKNDDSKSFSNLRLSSQYGQEFVCKIPNLDSVLPKSIDGEQVFPEDFTTLKIVETVKSGGFLTRPCLKKTVGWWTYEVCFGSEIKQYHLDGADIQGGAISLGYFEKDFDWDQFLIDRKTDPSTSKPKNLFHSQWFTNGTLCDINSSLRKTQVKFLCEEDLSYKDAYIYRVDEPATCEYVMTVYVGSLCQLPQFIPLNKPKTPNGILCHPLLKDDVYEQFLRAKAKEDSIKLKREQENTALKPDSVLNSLLSNVGDNLTPLQMMRKSAVVNEALQGATKILEDMLKLQAKTLGLDGNKMRLLNFDLNLFGDSDLGLQFNQIYNTCPRFTWRDVLIDGRSPNIDYVALYSNPIIESEEIILEEIVPVLQDQEGTDISPTEYSSGSGAPSPPSMEPSEQEDVYLEDVIWDKIMQPENGVANVFKYMFFHYIKDTVDLTEDDLVRVADPRFRTKNIRDELSMSDSKYDAMEELLIYKARQLLLVSKRERHLRKEMAAKGIREAPEPNLIDYLLEGEEIEEEYLVEEIIESERKKQATRILLAKQQKVIEKELNKNVVEPVQYTEEETLLWKDAVHQGAVEASTNMLDFVVKLRLDSRKKHGPKWRQFYFHNIDYPQAMHFQVIPPNPKPPLPEIHPEEAYQTGYILDEVRTLVQDNRPASGALVDKIWDVWFFQEEMAEEGDTPKGGDLEEAFWKLFMQDSGTFRRSFLENLRTIDELQKEPIDDNERDPIITLPLPWTEEEFESREDFLVFWVRRRVLATRRQKYLDRQRNLKGIDVSEKKLGEALEEKYYRAFDEHVLEVRKHDRVAKKALESGNLELWKSYDTSKLDMKYDQFYQIPRAKLAELERDEIMEKGGERAQMEPVDFTINEMDKYQKYIDIFNQLHLENSEGMSLTEFAFTLRLSAVKKHGKDKWKQIYFQKDENPQSLRTVPGEKEEEGGKSELGSGEELVGKGKEASTGNADSSAFEESKIIENDNEVPSRPPVPDIPADPLDTNWRKEIEKITQEIINKKQLKNQEIKTQEELKVKKVNKYTEPVQQDGGSSNNVKVRVKEVEGSADLLQNELHRQVSPHAQTLEANIKQKLKEAGFDSKGKNVQVKIITGGIVDEKAENNFKLLSDEESKQFSDMLINILGAESELAKEDKKHKSLESGYSFKFDEYIEENENQ